MPKVIQPKKKRAVLSATQKKEICEQKQANPKLSDSALSQQYNTERSTITKILRQSEKWLAVEIATNAAQAKTTKQPTYPRIQEAMTLWVSSVSNRGLTLTGDLLKQKALDFAVALGEGYENFKASDGWLAKFKKRLGLRQYRIHGESQSAPLEFIPQMRRDLNELLTAYTPDNIFNADETGLYYRMDSNSTLAMGPVSGKKKDKTRITIMFTTNASGTMSLKPLVINNSKMPNAFRHAGITHAQLPVDYGYNNKSWMRHDIFQVALFYSELFTFLIHSLYIFTILAVLG
jgi:Tc5 transposase DNA-binding domain/DDE superfamily endonuclease